MFKGSTDDRSEESCFSNELDSVFYQNLFTTSDFKSVPDGVVPPSWSESVLRDVQRKFQGRLGRQAWATDEQYSSELVKSLVVSSFVFWSHLNQSRNSVSPNNCFSDNGNIGIYCQYTHARLKRFAIRVLHKWLT